MYWWRLTDRSIVCNQSIQSMKWIDDTMIITSEDEGDDQRSPKVESTDCIDWLDNLLIHKLIDWWIDSHTGRADGSIHSEDLAHKYAFIDGSAICWWSIDWKIACWINQSINESIQAIQRYEQAILWLSHIQLVDWVTKDRLIDQWIDQLIDCGLTSWCMDWLINWLIDRWRVDQWWLIDRSIVNVINRSSQWNGSTILWSSHQQMRVMARRSSITVSTNCIDWLNDAWLTDWLIGSWINWLIDRFGLIDCFLAIILFDMDTDRYIIDSWWIGWR